MDSDELRRRNRAPLERVKAERRRILRGALAPALGLEEADVVIDALEKAGNVRAVHIEREDGGDVVIRLIPE